MSDPSTIDRISKEAESFGALLDSANKSSPLFAKALLGNVTSPVKTQVGTLVAGLVAAAASSYGFNWSDFTVLVVTTLIMTIFNTVVQWWQVWRYRKTLPVIAYTADPAVSQPSATPQPTVNPPTP